MSNKALVLLSGIALSLGLAGASPAANADDGSITRGGVLRCGGTNNSRLNGSEMQFTGWDLRNLSSTTSITVERVTIFAATGAVLFDSRVLGQLPAFTAGVPLGPNNNVLGPNQTTGLSSLDVLWDLPAELRPIQVEFVWSAPARVPPLDVRTIRISRERIAGATGGFTLGADRARGDFSCISIG